MPEPPPLCTREGLVSPVRTDRRGGHPTPQEARGPAWRRTSRGFYVPSSVSSALVEQRIVEAAAVVPPRCAITGWAALRWQGGRWFPGTGPGGEQLPVTILVGTHDIRPQQGIAVSAESVAPEMTVVVDGLPVIRPAWAVSFEMRYAASERGATRVLDMAAYSDLVSINEQSALLTPRQNSWTGIPQARAALLRSEENAWSPAEVDLRLTWEQDAHLLTPRCNTPVFDLAGRHIGTPDVIDPQTGVTGEYEGAHHLERGQRTHDVRRESAFRGQGLEVVTMVATDRTDTSHFVERLHAAVGRARALTGPRRWTLEKPAWWVPTETVDQRRALSSDQRDRFLAHRVG